MWFELVEEVGTLGFADLRAALEGAGLTHHAGETQGRRMTSLTLAFVRDARSRVPALDGGSRP